MVKLELPAVVGVPDSTPDDDSVIPPGSVPDDTAKLYGAVPPLAVSVWLYGVPTVPAGSVDGLSVIAGQLMVSV